MAWCYVLRQIRSKNGLDELVTTGARVAFHVGIPDSENEVDISYRDAVVELAANGQVSVPSLIKDLEARFPERYAKLQSGEAMEIVEEMDYPSTHLTVEQRTASIAARASAIAEEVIDILLLELGLSGLEIDD